MTSNPEQMKMKLTLATPVTLPEVKVLLKDLYNQIETLQNEIRKISENRPRTDKVSGKPIQTS